MNSSEWPAQIAKRDTTVWLPQMARSTTNDDEVILRNDRQTRQE